MLGKQETGTQVIMMPESMPTYSKPREVAGDILRELDPETHLKRLKLILMGYDVSTDAKEVQKNWDPIINKHGVRDIIAEISPFSSKVGLTGNLKEVEIRVNAASTQREVILMLMDNHKEYGIKSPTDLSKIAKIVQNFLLLFLSHSKEAGLIDKITKMRNESVMVTPQEQKPGFFARLTGR